MEKKILFTHGAKVTIEPLEGSFQKENELLNEFFKTGASILAIINRMALRKDLFDESDFIHIDEEYLKKNAIAPHVMIVLLGLLFGASRIYTSALILSESTLGESAMVLLRTLLERYVNARAIMGASDPNFAASDYMVKSTIEEEKSYRMLSESSSGEFKKELEGIVKLFEPIIAMINQNETPEKIKEIKRNNWFGKSIEEMCNIIGLAPMYSYYRFTSFVIHGLDFFRYIEGARGFPPEKMQMLSVFDSKQTILTCTLIIRDMLQDILVFLNISERMEMVEINRKLGECMLKYGADEKTVAFLLEKSLEHLKNEK